MKQIPESQRPYEKCLQNGPEALTDAELLAVILRTGSRSSTVLELARKILSLAPEGDGLTGLFHLSISQLCELEGIGRVKSVQILCIGELSKRIARTQARKTLSFQDPETIAAYYMETLRHEDQEHVFCMMLDTKCHFLGETELTRGTVNLSVLSPREVFLAALSWRAVFLILIHNHPSGDALPSEEDRRITERIRKAGEMIGITLLDHIIIGDRTFFSFAQDEARQNFVP